MPEHALVLSETVTVAAAQLAGAASQAAVEAAEVRDGGRRLRRRRERKGKRVMNNEKEGVQHLDTPKMVYRAARRQSPDSFWGR